MTLIPSRIGWLPIPPFLVGGVFPYLATYLDGFLPDLSLGTWRWLGVVLFIAGCTLASVSARLIYASQQWNKQPTPLGVPKRLVLEGPYQHVRNPMFLGMLQIVLGEGLYFQSLAILGYLVALFLFANLWLFPGEERRLESQFGGEYGRYKAEVGRWIPRWRPYKSNIGEL
jgi:protein-S-isoprenylcysteine O-methyltransferase Ste14